MANKIFNTASFSGPKFSHFDMTHPNLVSMKFGECVPVYWDFLNPNDKAVFDMSQVVRVSPMLQPILSQVDITVDAFAVRLRSLGMAERNPWVYEDFFNANKNLDGSYTLPRALASDIGLAANFKLGSLYDYLGFPTLDTLRKEIRKQIAFNPYLLSSAIGVLVQKGQGLNTTEVFGALGSQAELVPLLGSRFSTEPESTNSSATWKYHYFHYGPSDYGFHFGNNGTACTIPPISFFALALAIGLESDSDIASWLEVLADRYAGYPFYCYNLYDLNGVDSHYSTVVSVLNNLRVKSLPQYLFDNFKLDWQSVEERYIDFVFQSVLGSQQVAYDNGSWDFIIQDGYFFEDVIEPIFEDNVGTVQASAAFVTNNEGLSIDEDSLIPSQPSAFEADITRPTGSIYAPLYPALSYWKIISDWYLNTGLFEPDQFFLDKVFKNVDGEQVYNLQSLFGECFKRNWSPDYFTSAFDSAQRGLAVGVPADGTIPDLRNATALQKFKERLLFAGHKFRDVIYSIFGIKMSSAIADMSEVLGRWVNPVNIDSTLQTSESTPESPLASYAGTGLSFGHKNNILHYVAEEPTVIMFVASIRPKYAIYYQGFPKKLRRNYLMDYAIPGFANVGEQMISNRELYCDLGAGDSEVFGFTRRFADFMVAMGECHGDFKDNLDTWHLARQFGESPLLNQQFLAVDGQADNLNRVFATSSDAVDKFYCNFFFNGGIVRSIPKRIYFDL